MSVPVQPLFARPEFRAVAGDALRPGGLELTRRALALCRLPPGGLVADMGCGPGVTARFLASEGHRVLALDPEAGFAQGLRGAPGVTPLRARAEALPLADACLDAVFCECALSVTGAAGRALAEAARVLRPGGALALSDVYLRGQGLRPAPDAPGDCLQGAVPRELVLEQLGAAGLRAQAFEDHSRLLAELAGRLILSGAGGTLGGACSAGLRPGYYLCVARKPAAA